MHSTHGHWCNTKTWPTKCPACDAQVYFFQCDCGSKVFFDDLGGNWTIHDCNTSWAKNLIRHKDNSGGITVEISNGITVSRAPESFNIEASIINNARKRKTDKPDPIVSIKPENVLGKTTVIGILREITLDVDISKALNIPSSSPIATAFLGHLGNKPLGKITVHVPSSKENVLQSYTIWMPKDILQNSKGSRGVSVWVEISPVSIPNFGEIWSGSFYETLG
jgi:hypothetical protein